MVSTAKRNVLLCFGFGFTLRAFIKRLPASFDCRGCLSFCRVADGLLPAGEILSFCGRVG